jgi:phosphoribosylformimino-5-aminoimidazole carboxamide ribotide isomerase
LFNVIPVIDLIDGEAVLAKAGDRQRYKPLNTPLCNSSEPLAVAEAYLSLYPFSNLYIADLDAIRGNRSNRDIIKALHRKFPAVQFWIDGGFRDRAMLSQSAIPGTRPVIGSESLVDIELLTTAHAPLLSLDYQQDRLLGPASLKTDIHLWPRDVIVMSMSQIGSDSGPDWQRLQTLQQCAPTTNFYAAGGVRNFEDLQQLAILKCHGALLATALHYGAIDTTSLQKIIQVPGKPGT